MPVYEYELVRNGEAVGRIELPMAAADRDKVVIRRVTVPRRLNVVLGAPDPHSADVATPKAFRQLEDTMPADRIARESGFSVRKIKEVWGL